MPQVGTSQLDANGHVQGGTDCHPFVTVDRPVESYEQHIRYALDAGINGFQMLTWPDPKMYEAARNVFKKTGQLFYVAPLWCDQGKDFAKAVEQMANFAVDHKDDPHVFRLNGKQVHFFYGVSWADSDTDDKILQAKEMIKAKGAEVLFMPADGHYQVQPADKQLLDRTELEYAPWPTFKAPEPGPLTYLAATKWDGCDTWGPCDVTASLATAITDRLLPYANRYLFLPAAWPGYDSSNRAWQAIHCPHRGVGVLRDNLRLWTGMGYRQLVLVTWNDVNETMLLPSTRSPFGFSKIIRYYHELALTGKSPFDTPQFIVAYDPETLYGDELYVQLLAIPEKNAYSSNYLFQVSLENEKGEESASLTMRGSVPDERTDLLAETRLDTTSLIGKAETLSPVVSVYRVDAATNERQLLHAKLRLAPVTLRYNKIQFFTSYAIDLAHVAPDAALTLRVDGSLSPTTAVPSGGILPLTATFQGVEGLRRLSLAENRLTRGAFRPDDTVAEIGPGMVRAFLRVRCDRDITYSLNVANGTISERYTNHWDSTRLLTKIATASCESKAFPLGKPTDNMPDAIGKPVFRVTATPDSAITLTVKGADKTLVETTLAHLAANPVVTTADIDGVKTTVRLEWSIDAIEANVDYPLPKAGEYLRFVPIDRSDDATRYFHAWALTETDRIVYSRPLVVIRAATAAGNGPDVSGSDASVSCQLIRTRGVFDDFVNSSSSAAQNPFTPADLVCAPFPARLVPYYLLDMEEGAGTQLNDGGTAHQCGRSWLSGDVEWIADGWKGTALRLKGGQIQMKSKSFPHGAYTFSARVRAKTPATAEPIAADGDYWQNLTTEGVRIDLLPDGRIKARREIRDSVGEAVSHDRIRDGWNHIVVTYDLQALRIYLNGALSAESPVSKPGYQRTHSMPYVGFSQAEKAKRGKDAPNFTGDIDQIEIIGTALDAAAVRQLNAVGQWLPR